MRNRDAVTVFGSFRNKTRLHFFRPLARAGARTPAPGEVARGSGWTPSSLPFQVIRKEDAGFVQFWRADKTVRHAVDLWVARLLLSHPIEDCFDGHPQVCGDLNPAAGSQWAESNMDTDKVFNVLFLCTGNSARSIMAECILNREGQGRFQGYSAGSHPKGEVNPYALHILKTLNYPTADLSSKDWSVFAAPGAPQMDFVFTVCDSAANEVCPVWPGQPMTAHWGIPDPAAVDGKEAEKAAAFADTMRMLTNRISIFVNLPMRSLDRLTLQERLDGIGREDAAVA